MMFTSDDTDSYSSDDSDYGDVVIVKGTSTETHVIS